jgi:type VI secretion system protein ImpL
MNVSKLPKPIDKWFKRALQNNWASLLLHTKKYISQKYRQNILVYYRDKIKGRYPLYKKSKKNDIDVNDFEEFLKKNGILDTFYRNYLSAFVKINTRSGTYSYVNIDGSKVYINKDFLNAMLKLPSIRRTLFSSKGDYLNTSLYLKPHALGHKLSRMEFQLGDDYISYEHGPIKSRKITWPSGNQNDIAQFSMLDIQNNRVVEMSKYGPWAMFKLLDKFTVISKGTQRGVESVLVQYKQNSMNGSFNISGTATRLFTNNNPLRRFQLPNQL